jgi:hypothetical protein
MATRKFQVGDVVIATDKIGTYWQKSRGIVPGVTRATVMDYRYDGEYRFRLEDGLDFYAKSTCFEKGKPKSSVDTFQEQIDKALEKIEATKVFIAETQSKIDYMKETNSDQFDENEFKAYHTLTIIEQSDMSKIEKAKAIAALIAG